MIAKISATENLGGALGYNFKKVNKEQAEVLLANSLYHNIDEKYSMEQVFADMKSAIPENCRTKKMVFHCSLNPHPDDKLSDAQFQDMAKEYMERMGYGKQPYMVFKHNDIAREHIHIVALRVDSEGNKINDKFERRRSKKITDMLEQKYSLIKSSNTNEQSAGTELVDTDMDNIKKQINNTMHSVLKKYSFCSIGELNAILSIYNLTVEEVKTEFKGKQYDGITYIPTDNNGNKIGNPINASDIGRGVGYSAVHNKMSKSKQDIKPYIQSIRKDVLAVMRTSPKTEEQMMKELSGRGLRAFIRKNGNGRIYGITFIDDEKGIALNGSRLGKGYSANKFNEYFLNTNENAFLDETLYGKNDIQEKNSIGVKSGETNENNNIIDELIDDFITDSPMQVGNDDWKEAAWQKKLRRQSKMNLRRRKK